MKKLIVKGIIAVAALFSFSIAGVQASTTAQAATTDATYSTVYNTAKKYLGKPYVYGATGPRAFDCSGFTGYVYKKKPLRLLCHVQHKPNTMLTSMLVLARSLRVTWSSLVTASTALATLVFTLVMAR